MRKSANLTIQQWGNSLAVRIPSAIAKSLRFSVGQPVEVSIHEEWVEVRPIGKPKLTLAQKCAAFDPHKHGGEAMASGCIGLETL
jgi:antitoxin MazE